jgi:integration host factor subunit beta
MIAVRRVLKILGIRRRPFFVGECPLQFPTWFVEG